MKSRNFILVLLLMTVCLQAQDKTALQYANFIDSNRMKNVLIKLTSEEFAGRKSNDKGAQLTADYLQAQLKQSLIKEGNKGSYLQNIQAFTKGNLSKYFMLSNINFYEHYSFANTPFQDSVIIDSNIVFAGYGLFHPTFNDFAGIDIKNKIVMVMEGDGPLNKYGVKCHNAYDIPNHNYIRSQNPKALIIVRNGFNTYRNYSSESLDFFSEQVSQQSSIVYVNELLANKILEPTNKTIKQLQFEIEGSCHSNSFEFKNKLLFNGDKLYKLANVNNVVGIIEGSDLKNEYVILSAHYDHLGKNYRDEVYAGADDNASGVSAVLEIAKVLNQAKKAGKGPRRTIVLLFTTAEEDGLYGSEFYIHKPIFPLEKTIACVNIDMVGRIGSEVSAENIKTGYVYALTENGNAVDSLFYIPDSINAISTKLSIISKESYYDYFRRSDHYNFYKKNIPSIMFTNGTHEDLHTIRDSFDKIDNQAMLERTKLAFLTTWELANNPKPFKKKQ